MMPPLVSVIVPAYNHAKFVRTCLQSVYQQDYTRLELIVVDDCSQDGTADLCRKFVAARVNKARFERCVLLRHEHNQGAYVALNDGVAEAKGRYITFLNSDDYYDKGRISACVGAAHGDECFVFTGVEAVDEQGDPTISYEVIQSIKRLLKARETRLPSLGFGFMGQQLAVSTGNLFVGRRLLEEAGPFANLRYCHDWDMAMRLIRSVEPLYVPKPLYFYRCHGTNSHLGLQNYADSETEYVLRSYFRAIKLGQISNPLAPSPVTWPGIFEMFAKSYGVYKWWQAESGAYPKGARVIAPSPDLEQIEI